MPRTSGCQGPFGGDPRRGRGGCFVFAFVPSPSNLGHLYAPHPWGPACWKGLFPRALLPQNLGCAAGQLPPASVPPSPPAKPTGRDPEGTPEGNSPPREGKAEAMGRRVPSDSPPTPPPDGPLLPAASLRLPPLCPRRSPRPVIPGPKALVGNAFPSGLKTMKDEEFALCI